MKTDVFKVFFTLAFIFLALYLRHDLTKGQKHEVLHGYELRASY